MFPCISQSNNYFNHSSILLITTAHMRIVGIQYPPLGSKLVLGFIISVLVMANFQVCTKYHFIC